MALNCHGGGAGSLWQSGDEAAEEGEAEAVAESSKARAEAKAASGADEGWRDGVGDQACPDTKGEDLAVNATVVGGMMVKTEGAEGMEEAKVATEAASEDRMEGDATAAGVIERRKGGDKAAEVAVAKAGRVWREAKGGLRKVDVDVGGANGRAKGEGSGGRAKAGEKVAKKDEREEPLPDLTASMAAEGTEAVAEVKVSGRAVKGEGGVVKGRAGTGRRRRY